MDLEVVRDVSPERLEPLRELIDVVSAHDEHEALGEHKWLDLVHGGRTDFAGVVATEPGHDHPVGYAHLSRHPGESTMWGLEVVVHPEHRGVGVESALVERALELAAGEGGGHLHLWVFRPTEIHEGIAHRFGLRKGRDLLNMRVPLPHPEEPRFPDDVTVRPFEPGRDEEAWLEVNNRAFAHHPEQGAWDRDTLERREKETWFDPSGFLLAVDPEGLAGFCWTKLSEDGSSGEIYVIAVDPSRQGRGLGRALVLAGLRSMAERGAATGTLYVDADQTPAVRLYEELGFSVHHLDRAYVTDVEPA